MTAFEMPTFSLPVSGIKISDISVDISPIYPISVMFDTISVSDISDIGDV